MIPDLRIFSDLIAAIVAILVFVGISRFVKKVFAIDLDLNISPHKIYCKSKKNEIVIETTLLVSADGKKPRILGVGEDVPKESYKKINVFPKTNESKTFEESKEILSAFFRTVFRKLTNKRKFHPFIKAKISGINTLEPIFGQATKELIQKSLKDAFVVKFNYTD